MNRESSTLVTSDASTHYLGGAGEKYFEWQNRDAPITGIIEARKFRNYIKATDTVLDFGCGGGHVLQNLECGRRLGVEVNPVARAEAIKQGVECYESLDSLIDNSLDVVISNHALEHVLFPIGVLKTLRNKLKPNGILLLCLPIDDWRTQLQYDPGDISHHLHTWTPQLLGNALSEAGFRHSEFCIRVFTHAWFPGTSKVYKVMPDWIFDSLCRIYSVLARRRQLLAVAQKGDYTSFKPASL